jgi:hypothetical protein
MQGCSVSSEPYSTNFSLNLDFTPQAMRSPLLHVVLLAAVALATFAEQFEDDREVRVAQHF